MIRFHFITAVWGNEYTDLFLNFCLPNQMTSGNLLAFRDDSLSCYKVFTSTQDALRIERNPLFKELQSLMKTKIILMDDLVSAERDDSSECHRRSLDSMTLCHQKAISEANSEGAALVFLMPDMVISNGMLEGIRRRANNGTRAVAISNLRLNKETFIPAFRKRHLNDSGRMPVSSRDLVRLAMKHLHSLTRHQFLGSNYFPQNYSHLYWKVGESGLLMRSPHYHPLFVWPRNKEIPDYPLDGGYHVLSVPDNRERELVTDSDEMISFELSSAGKISDTVKKGRFNHLVYAARAINKFTDTPNRKALLSKVKIHATEFSSEWRSTEKESDKVVRSILSAYALCKRYSKWYEPPTAEPLTHRKGERVVIFGTGSGGKLAFTLAQKCEWHVKYFVDNDKLKWGNKISGIPVYSPETIVASELDFVLIASAPGREAISKQLDEMGFSYENGDYLFFKEPVFNGQFYFKMG